MEREMTFSLSYEQLTRLAEERIGDCDLDSHGMIYTRESAKAAAFLEFWYALAVHGVPLKNFEQTKEIIEADYLRLRKLVWPEADKQ